jgi:exopolysaccharide biosynthesis polyprenyl glycosylphosphotransferase
MWKFPFSQHQREYVVLVLGDAFLLLFSIALSEFTGFTPPIWLKWDLNRLIWVGGFLLFGPLLFLYLIRAFNPESQERPIFLLVMISVAMGFFFLFYSTLSYYFTYLRVGKLTLLSFVVINILLIYSWHHFVAKYFPKKIRRILIIGHDKFLEEIVQIINNDLPGHYAVVANYHRGNVNPSIPNLQSVVKNKGVDLIIYSVQSKILKNASSQLLSLRFQKTDIYDAFTFYQAITGKFPIYHLDHFWMLINSQRDFILPKISDNLKRAFDILFCFICLPVALPLIIISGLLIKLSSKGPIFFIQERLGKNEAPFRLMKLRTMITEAEKDFGPRWATKNDPRITGVGRVLRKLRLDELPQIFNVLKGEMSVVGPRPIRHHFADLLAQEVPYYRLRFLVKPGLTGWAQVNGDYAGSMKGQAEKFQYDLFYLVHQSMLLDLFILFKTIRVMAGGSGT